MGEGRGEGLARRAKELSVLSYSQVLLKCEENYVEVLPALSPLPTLCQRERELL